MLVRESRAPRPPKLDPGGVRLITAALLLLLYPLVEEGRQPGWPAWTFVSMAAAAPVFAAFIGYERHKTRRDGLPLVPSLFRERGFSAGMAIAIAFFLGIASFGLVLTLFLQLGLSFTPLHAGLTFLPFSVGVLLASGAAARLAPRFGRGVIMAGALIIAAGMAAPIAVSAPLRGRGDHLGAHPGPGRGGPRPGSRDRATGRHRAGPGAEARTPDRRPASSTPACSSATRSASR